MPIAPVQLENATVPAYLKDFDVLLLSYDGQKPLSPEVHAPIANWVRDGGVLVVIDADADPYLRVREWWNSDGRNYPTPRRHLFEALDLPDEPAPSTDLALVPKRVGKGAVLWRRERPAAAAESPEGEARMIETLRAAVAASRAAWNETDYLLLQRGPYRIAAGLAESPARSSKKLLGRFVNLFDPELRVVREVVVSAGTRWFLRDVEAIPGEGPSLVAAACSTRNERIMASSARWTVEGVADTPAIVLVASPRSPTRVTLGGDAIRDWRWDPSEKLIWIRFGNLVTPRALELSF